jgi:preprotein translocase subunit SecY
MDWFKRLPGFQRSPSGLEWVLWKKLPRIFLWGTALPVAVAVGWHWLSADVPTAAQERSLQLFDYVMAGAVALHWTLVLTLAIGCVIVMLMKGPAYVADAYEVNDSDHPA